jgi:hypothetical protein
MAGTVYLWSFFTHGRNYIPVALQYSWQEVYTCGPSVFMAGTVYLGPSVLMAGTIPVVLQHSWQELYSHDSSVLMMGTVYLWFFSTHGRNCIPVVLLRVLTGGNPIE